LADKKTETIRGMIAQRLKAVASAELSHLPAQPHLDEDVIAAFVEGRLGDSECQPVLAHLAACGACRRASAQMVQLENQVDSEPAGDVADEPGRLGMLLSKFGSMVSASGEEVVFAYQDSEEEEKKEQSPNMPATNDNQQ
jgi:putative zinc finger protein